MIGPPDVDVGGYPLSFTIRAANVSLAWPNGFGFTGQALKVVARPWSPHKLNIDATGGFAFTLPPGTVRPALTLAGETLRGRVAFGDEPIPMSVSLTADTVSASRTAVAGEAGRELTVATVSFTGERPPTPPTAPSAAAYDFALRLLDLSAVAMEDIPLGGEIQELSGHVKLMGPPPATADADGLRGWRDAGGTIDLDNLLLRWGPLRLAGSGTAALDEQMQPEGAFTAHLSGVDAAVDAVAAAGWIKPNAAGLAKLALGLASRPGPDGKPVVDTPLTVQNRRISLGPVKIGEVPELKLD